MVALVNSSILLEPEGNVARPRIVTHDEAADLLLRARVLPSIRLDRDAARWVGLIARGEVPVNGFVGSDELASLDATGRLADGTPLAHPPLLLVREAPPVREAALVDDHGVLGVIEVFEVFPAAGQVAVAGRVTVARLPEVA